MSARTRVNAGWTLVELLVVIAIISILLGMLVVVVLRARGDATNKGASMAMSTVTSAIESYRVEFGRYPPDSLPSHPGATGSEILAWYLGQRFTVGESHPGPYIPPNKLRTNPSSGLQELPTPFRRSYIYGLLYNDDHTLRGYLLIDAGPDGLLGGAIDPVAGFVPDSSDASKDNIYGGEQPR
jgi:prepilin-type N-terminal cleavage/methylation domain-containing protein